MITHENFIPYPVTMNCCITITYSFITHILFYAIEKMTSQIFSGLIVCPILTLLKIISIQGYYNKSPQSLHTMHAHLLIFLN